MSLFNRAQLVSSLVLVSAVAAVVLIVLARRFELVIDVPIAIAIAIAAPAHVTITALCETALSERGLDLSRLEIPLDPPLTNDVIQLETTTPVATQLATPLGITVTEGRRDDQGQRSHPSDHSRARPCRAEARQAADPEQGQDVVQLGFPLEQTFRVRMTVRMTATVPLRLSMIVPHLRRHE